MAELIEDDVDLSQCRTLEEPDYSSCDWFFEREIIENSSPSRQDGIDAAKESYLRKSYCTFLQDLGMRLKVPQLTIATAIVFCHRFFLRQSHAKNDRYVIATACMFLAGKVEETPKLLQNVICIAYEIRHRKEPEVVQRIKIKEVYEREKEIVLLGEHLVLSTLEFDLNVHHPYKPLVAAIKKMKVAQNSLAQVAWNFVNDGLRTSICLQFKAHHIAAGAIFLAAKFLKVKLPSNGKKPWWQEFDVTPRQLEDVSNQMLELYEQIREISASRWNDLNGSLNHDKRAVNALPPGTPQVAEKRSAVEVKSRAAMEVNQQPRNGETKTSWADLEQVNLEKLKTAVEKRKKLKAETGGAKSKLELTDEEELLERDLEDGQKDHTVSLNAKIYNINNYTGDESKLSAKSEFVEETDQPDSYSDNKQWPLHTRGDHHATQTKRTDKIDYQYHSQKSRDWEEREHKRLRSGQVD